MTGLALVVVDAQVGTLEPPTLDGEAVVRRIASLLDRARARGVPVIYVQHSSSPGGIVDPATPRWPIHPGLAPRAGEPVVHKQACDAFHRTSLLEELRRAGATRVMVAGCMTQYCIDTFCRRATSEGYPVTLVSDGHTTRDGGGLTARQIIDHHNLTLDGFGTAEAAVSLRPHDRVEL